MIMKSDINKLVCILLVHLSSTSLENFEDRSLINPEILELIKLHTYKFGLVYLCSENKGTDQICGLVFTYAKSRFSHNEAHFVYNRHSRLYIAPSSCRLSIANH